MGQNDYTISMFISFLKLTSIQNINLAAVLFVVPPSGSMQYDAHRCQFTMTQSPSRKERSAALYNPSLDPPRDIKA